MYHFSLHTYYIYMIVSHGNSSISGADLCVSRCPQAAQLSVSLSYHDRISAYQRVSARITSQAARKTCGDLGDVRALVSHGTTCVSALYHATVSASRIMRYQRVSWTWYHIRIRRYQEPLCIGCVSGVYQCICIGSVVSTLNCDTGRGVSMCITSYHE